jgi:hypothetical protein
MRMLNKYASANTINNWLTEISEDNSKDIKSVSLVYDGDTYVLAVVLYEDA